MAGPDDPSLRSCAMDGGDEPLDDHRSASLKLNPTLLRATRSPTMSEIPGDLKFLKSHEWARVEGDGKVTVGISDHAQGLLGDLVYVELPNVGDRIEAGNACAVVESVKAASDVYAPVSGKVVEVNSALADKPETINEDAYGDGWLFVVEADEPDQLNELLGPDDYAELLEDDEH
jgi:glycine cleavage system H protein